MKKLQYISPACKVIDVNVECQFLQFSRESGTGIGQKPIDSEGDNELDVKGDGGFWDEW